MEFGRWFIPGPSEVHPDVLAAMTRPVLYHRTPEIEALYARAQPTLQEIFGTQRPVFVFTTSGTGAVEAGVRALPRGRVLALVNGAFSGRFADIAAACGLEVDRFEVAWGQVHDPDEVGHRVAQAEYRAVTVVHSETSTGALQPLAELARAAGDLPLLVDSVSGAAGAPIDMDAAGIAYACTGSQKALALPPGLAFGVASESFLEQAERATERGLFLDLLRYAKRQPPFTPAVSLLYALDIQLERIRREGVEARWARHQAMAERTWAWADQAGLEVLAPPGFRSPTVTCIRHPRAPALVRHAYDRGYTIGGGYGKLKPTTFRIGHMGDQSLETLENLLAVCGSFGRGCA